MKKLFIMCLVMSSTSTFAARIQEFDQDQEVKCHSEIKKIGCANSDEADINCVEKKKAGLSAACKSMHASKMKNK
jgi:hypothetical protein